MTVVSIHAERHKRRKATQHGAEGEDTRAAIVKASHRSISDFLARGPRKVDLARDGDDPSREVCALEGAFTRDSLQFLHRINQVNASNAGLILSVAEFWAQFASNILHQSRELLHRAMSVSLTVKDHLGRSEGACLRDEKAKLR